MAVYYDLTVSTKLYLFSTLFLAKTFSKLNKKFFLMYLYRTKFKFPKFAVSLEFSIEKG